ncbi:MAG: type II toxin-antitoxin system HicA family toxin [Thermoplasmata archaeon]|nr:type II toxin-antitoxin system HicA family toxin [Thermoplasmata archaeon]
MTKLPLLSAHKIIKALSKVGFELISQKGSHIKLKRKYEGKVKVVIVPNFNEVPAGTLRSIIRQSGLDMDDFLKLL